MKNSNKNQKTKYGTISLPIPLIENIKKKIEGTGVPSVSAYVTFVLRLILSAPDSEDSLNKNAEFATEKRLKKLGYI